MIWYLRETKELPLTLDGDNSHVINWWVDAAFAVQPNMWIQSSAEISLGKGVVYESSVRHKLNTQSSIPSEKNGKGSSSKMKRQINIHFFFI